MGAGRATRSELPGGICLAPALVGGHNIGVASPDPPAQSLPERWTASTVFADMWLDADSDPREGGPAPVDERTTLLEYLRTYRLTLSMKCADLDAEQLARRSVPPSTMSLLGLVRHMAEVERHWFRRVMSGEDAPSRYRAAGPEGDWTGAVPDPDVVAEAWEAWGEEVAYAERFVGGMKDLGSFGHNRDGTSIPLRSVLVHMIEEYARHCGHADLLRERIDGRVGQ
jgi:uncharacterized damage-inducible protein DinB